MNDGGHSIIDCPNVGNIHITFYYLSQMKRMGLLLFLILGMAFSANSQSTLLLVKKKKSAKTGRFYPGDQVKVITKGGRKQKGLLVQITPKSIYLDQGRVPLDSIYKLKKYNMNLIGNGLTMSFAGVLFTGIVVTNGLINNDSPIITGGEAAVAGGFLISGALLARLGIKSYKIDDRHYFEVIDFTKFAEPVNPTP